MSRINLEDFRKRLNEDLVVIDAAFQGGYGSAIEGLLGLSREDIDRVVPGALDMRHYDKLLALVRRASSSNMPPAQLRARIVLMGEIAVRIAKRVDTLEEILK